jgi:diguanylate cyclase (GGDEF)-like protein/PAS domain S-box-containing protein
MKHLPPRARVYVVLVVVTGIALLTLLSQPPVVDQFVVLAGLVAAAIASSALKVHLPTTRNRATVSASFVVDFAALILFGPNLAMWISTVSAISQSTVRVAQKNPPHRTLFNAASLVVTMQVSGVAYAALGGHFGGLAGLGDATPLTGAVLVYFLVNSGLIAVAVALSTFQPVLRVWQRDFLWGGPTYFVSAGVAVVLVEAVARQMWMLLPLVVLAAYLIYLAYGVYVGRLQDEHRHRDVIESLNEAMTALKQSEERYALAAAGANDGLWDWDLEHDTIYFSPRWNTMLGLPHDAASLRAEDWLARVHRDDLAALQAALDAHLAGQTTHFEHQHRIRHEDGAYRAILCRGLAVRADNGRPVRLAGFQTDVTERAAVLEQLRHAALHDTLTDLPNRALFMELLGQALDRSRRHPDRLFAVLFLDIDRFKVVNDSLGHQIGDQLLVAISRRIESCLRGGDVIARLGGDEFTILLNDLSEVSRASLIAQRIHDVLRRPFAPEGHEVSVTASIGIASSVAGYTQPEHIMRDADTAMYRAKALGKARHEVYDPSPPVLAHARMLERLVLENDIRRAVDHGSLMLHYQPIVSLPTGEWTGFKALVRWNRAGREVPRDELVERAEETGMIEGLGDWVMQTACGQIAAWHSQFPYTRNLGVTVTVATAQLARLDFVAVVRQILEAARMQPGHLCLEIAATTLMDDPERAAGVLHDLRALGVRVSLDDGGNGFSPITFLHRFPIDALKIHRSLIKRFAGSDTLHDPPIVESVVALGNALGVCAMAEGVETAEQLRELLRVGCNEAQGDFFSKPLPAVTAEAVLAAYDARAAVSRAAGQTPFVTIH